MIIINCKKKVIATALTLSLVVPTTALAATGLGGDERQGLEKFRTAFAERSNANLLEERQQLRQENAQLREQNMLLANRDEIPEELAAKFAELRAKFESGEITREQLIEERQQHMPEKLQLRKGELCEGLELRLEEKKLNFEHRNMNKKVMSQKFENLRAQQ